MSSRSDDRIVAACLSGTHPDWRALGRDLGMSPDEVMGRAVSIGAWWLRGITPDSSKRAEFVLRLGKGPEDIARALGTDIHGALVWAGMKSLYGKGRA